MAFRLMLILLKDLNRIVVMGDGVMVWLIIDAYFLFFFDKNSHRPRRKLRAEKCESRVRQ